MNLIIPVRENEELRTQLVSLNWALSVRRLFILSESYLIYKLEVMVHRSLSGSV